MMSEAEKDRIATEIGKLFEGLDVGDVADVMTVQLAMLAAQGGDSLDDAIEFLDEIRDDAAEILDTIDFDGAGSDAEEGEEEAEAPAAAAKPDRRDA